MGVTFSKRKVPETNSLPDYTRYDALYKTCCLERNLTKEEIEMNDKGTLLWEIAARHNMIHLIKRLHINGLGYCNEHIMDDAARNGNLEIIKFLHFNRNEGCTKKAMDYAACNGHLEIIKWLHENRDEGCTSDAMNSAVASGNLEVVKFLYENLKESCFTTYAMYLAENIGHREISQYFHHIQLAFNKEKNL